MTHCRTHPAIPATTRCSTCGDGLCEDCRRTDAAGRDACSRCAPAPVPLGVGRRRAVRHAWLAWMLSVIPGLGQVYVGLPERGLVQFGLWCAGIFLASVIDGLLAGLIVVAWLGFWAWVSIDAFGAAKDVNRAGRLLGPDEWEAAGRGPLLGLRADARSAGVGLCILGALLLLQQFAGWVAALARLLVPLALMAAGAWVVARARRREAEAGAAAPEVDAGAPGEAHP